MSLKTMIELSGKWHDAVASSMTGPPYEFPAAWGDTAKIGGYEIVPILSGGDLYREGYAMHHCVGPMVTASGAARFMCSASAKMRHG
jgi:hypothetical protein